MQKIQGAVIMERGVKFAIVIVQRHLLESQADSQSTAHAFGPYFPRMPIVLMAQDSRGMPTYWGRKDIIGFLANVTFAQIPWKEYSFDF
jgi:hypothetical protein